MVDLYGSLSPTGKGHATDVAIVMGLAGNSPQNVDIDGMPAFIQRVMHSGRPPIANGAERRLSDGGRHRFTRKPSRITKRMRITAPSGAQAWASQTYYSIGGGLSSKREPTGDAGCRGCGAL